jgi:cation/acetate symporter
MPSLVFSLFWKRFSTTGALYSMYGGMGIALILVILSPAVSGTPASMLPGVDFALFPLANPGIVAIPMSFLLGVIGTLVGPRDDDADARFAEMEVRALTGAGAEGGPVAVTGRPTPRPRVAAPTPNPSFESR